MERIARLALYFFFYSALGWLIESSYCSVRPRKWVNRGFLTGPLCPIYGTGAIVFAVFVDPLRDIKMYARIGGYSVDFRPAAVFLAGLVLADIVEFTVSLMMEKLFHARWWDYSNRLLNIQGRICLLHSLYWGTASVGFLYIMHPFFEGMFDRIPIKYVYIILGVILAIFFIDVADAVRKAADVRKLMDKLKTFGSKVSTAIGGTVEDVISLSIEEINAISDKFGGYKDEAQKQFADIKEQFAKLTGDTKQSFKERNRMFREFPMFKKYASDQIENIEKKIEAFKNRFRQ